MLTCVIYNCMHSNEQQGRLELLMSNHEDYRRRQVGECADIHVWYKQIQPTETVDLYLINLPTGLCASETTDGLTVWPFCDVHIDISTTLSLLQCLRVICGCRPIQTNSAEKSLALLHM